MDARSAQGEHLTATTAAALSGPELPTRRTGVLEGLGALLGRRWATIADGDSAKGAGAAQPLALATPVSGIVERDGGYLIGLTTLEFINLGPAPIVLESGCWSLRLTSRRPPLPGPRCAHGPHAELKGEVIESGGVLRRAEAIPWRICRDDGLERGTWWLSGWLTYRNSSSDRRIFKFCKPLDATAQEPRA